MTTASSATGTQPTPGLGDLLGPHLPDVLAGASSSSSATSLQRTLSLAADRVAFVDLDNVHRNAPLYDVAYLLAHVLLHHLRWPADALALVVQLGPDDLLSAWSG